VTRGSKRSQNLDTIGTPPGKRTTGPRGALSMASFNGTFDPYKTVLDKPERICNGTASGYLTAADLPTPYMRPGACHAHIASKGTPC
jgi:hypothetical protein